MTIEGDPGMVKRKKEQAILSDKRERRIRERGHPQILQKGGALLLWGWMLLKYWKRKTSGKWWCI